MMDKFKMNAKALLFPALASVTAAGSSVVAFAAGSSGSPALELPKINITTEMLQPLVEGIVANVNVVLPVGLGIMSLMIGIRIIPALIRRFTGA
ncbi:MAG: hypothetical protein HFF14_05210 [Angelakisella sp.]|jgi:hypothetical protein|nr:hypothetical protein [Angelakisella sp.]